MPHGLMLVTGPTGSGKSTTLYACLNKLNEPDTNICTVEDPVEYKFRGINQVQVKTQVGLTFASALRAFLRQDPDVIMVGEVRDQETAADLPPRRPDRPLRALDHPYQRLALGRQPSGGHGHRAVLAGLDVAGARSPAAHPPPVQGVQGAVRVRRGRRQKCYGLEAGQTLYRPKGMGATSAAAAGYRGRVGVFEVVRITARMANLIQSRSPPARAARRRPRRRHEAAAGQRPGQSAGGTEQSGRSSDRRRERGIVTDTAAMVLWHRKWNGKGPSRRR